MTSKTVIVEIHRDGPMCYIPVPFDPKLVFGKIRAPVNVTVNGYTYRSTIASMCGITGIPLRKSHREAAGLSGGEKIAVTIALDVDVRDVVVPKDFQKILKANPVAWNRWRSLSFTNKRELVESIETAKKPETRVRRISKAMEFLGDPKHKQK